MLLFTTASTTVTTTTTNITEALSTNAITTCGRSNPTGFPLWLFLHFTDYHYVMSRYLDWASMPPVCSWADPGVNIWQLVSFESKGIFQTEGFTALRHTIYLDTYHLRLLSKGALKVIDFFLRFFISSHAFFKMQPLLAVLAVFLFVTDSGWIRVRGARREAGGKQAVRAAGRRAPGAARQAGLRVARWGEV